MTQGKRSKSDLPTRAKSEKLIANGADPTPFLAHPNYHVVRKAWIRLGRPNVVENAAKVAPHHVKMFEQRVIKPLVAILKLADA